MGQMGNEEGLILSKTPTGISTFCKRQKGSKRLHGKKNYCIGRKLICKNNISGRRVFDSFPE